MPHPEGDEGCDDDDHKPRVNGDADVHYESSHVVRHILAMTTACASVSQGIVYWNESDASPVGLATHTMTLVSFASTATGAPFILIVVLLLIPSLWRVMVMITTLLPESS